MHTWSKRKLFSHDLTTATRLGSAGASRVWKALPLVAKGADKSSAGPDIGPGSFSGRTGRLHETLYLPSGLAYQAIGSMHLSSRVRVSFSRVLVMAQSMGLHESDESRLRL